MSLIYTYIWACSHTYIVPNLDGWTLVEVFINGYPIHFTQSLLSFSADIWMGMLQMLLIYIFFVGSMSGEVMSFTADL